MSIRVARFGDIPGILSILYEQHPESIYADIEIDDKEAKSLVTQSIQRHGKTSFVAVCENNGKVEGFIIGALNRLYEIGTTFVASDVFWTTTKNAIPRDGVRLFMAFERWAMKNPNVSEVHCAVTDVIEDHHRTGKILRRRGYSPFGEILRKDVSK